MLSSDEKNNDLFFDSVDCSSPDEKVVSDSKSEKLEYELWINEPVSVKERREKFLRKMCIVNDKSSEVVELERTGECSGAIPSFLDSDSVEDYLVCGRDVNSNANCMVDEFEDNEENKQTIDGHRESSDTELSCSTDQDCKQRDNFGESVKFSANVERAKKWWKSLVSMKKRDFTQVSDIKSTPKTNQMKVKQKNKRCMELTGVFSQQEIKAHKGSIWTTKFSPDGQYLATGGVDGVVCVWRVTSTYVSCDSFLSEDKKKTSNASFVLPEKVFHLEDSPVHAFQGHSSDVLDLAWSNSNFLLSCSKDKTVRLWQVGCERCLHVFHHSDYVTCVQFNPMDENYFISGSIDGKVRIWGTSGKRVVDWADVRDVITAVCYQPDSNVFVVGTITGTCSFYKTSDNLELETAVHIPNKKKSFGKRITGIQFSQENPQRVMISSEDSKLQILDGLNVVHKFKGLPKSRNQMSASFTSTGKHIISVGEDSRVYVWNYDNGPSAKQTKSTQASEHFISEAASVAVPWSGTKTENTSKIGSLRSKIQVHDDHQRGGLRVRDSDRFSLGGWFSNDVPSKGSATWPEEKLPLWDVTTTEEEIYNIMPESWGLVIVTGGWDGVIRTFHNYGMPIRLH